MAAIDAFLMQVLERDGSDLHFLAGDVPRVRQYGELKPLRPEPLQAEMVQTTLYEIMPKLAVERFESKDGTDFAHSIPGVARFRVNVMRQLNGMGAVFRAIPSNAKTADELKLPAAVRDLSKMNNGLILVTGKTGSGKSTTLAAMIDDINTREKGHILTIEDPIEFVHKRKNCLISQREIGVHAATFSSALLSALREDPDVILVGELRDLETMSIAVTAAEMGILVMGTLHTNGAAATVDRLINAFPADKQPHVRTMLSTSLRGVVSQQLIPKADKKGRVAALEILINTPAIANLIRQGKMDQLENGMQTGAGSGMRLMDAAIQSLLDQRIITGKEAYKKAINKSRFEPLREAG
ncbi:MAG TPA: PilT/PilU family type 4a pilus ATPase [Steroidobacteraceae bacterium]|jgi:twitching motility protein PilT